MNREIKFRAWDNEKKVMRENVSTGTVDIWGGELGFDNDSESKNCEFMQYTGIKDKNGKEIYEGDIVDVKDTTMGTEDVVRGEVYFCEDYLEYSIQWLPKQSGADSMRLVKRSLKKDAKTPESSLGSRRWWFLEVIGNIYENPSLPL